MVFPRENNQPATVRKMNLQRHPRWALVLLILLVSCSDSPSRRQSETAQVLEVIDGDTIILTDGRDVRYMCIDTPERDEPYYEQASQLNRDLVGGKTVTLHFGQRRTDRYGRTLALVHQGEISVAESLVTVGLAIVYGFTDNADFLPPLILKQRQAIDRRIGLWSEPQIENEDYYIASVLSFRFHRPDCRSVSQIEHPRRMQYSSKLEAYCDGLSPCNRCDP